MNLYTVLHILHSSLFITIHLAELGNWKYLEVPFRRIPRACEVRSAPAWHALLSGRFHDSLCAPRKAPWGRGSCMAAEGFSQTFRAWQTWRFSVFQCLSDYNYSQKSRSSDNFFFFWETGACTLFQIAAVSGAMERARLVYLFEVGAFPPMISQLWDPLRPLAS